MKRVDGTSVLNRLKKIIHSVIRCVQREKRGSEKEEKHATRRTKAGICRESNAIKIRKQVIQDISYKRRQTDEGRDQGSIRGVAFIVSLLVMEVVRRSRVHWCCLSVKRGVWRILEVSGRRRESLQMSK